MLAYDKRGVGQSGGSYPGANHALVETQTGLTSEMLRSDTFAPGLFASMGEWLARVVSRCPPAEGSR